MILYLVTVVFNNFNFSLSSRPPNLFLVCRDRLFPYYFCLASLILYFEISSDAHYLEFLTLSTDYIRCTKIVMSSVICYSSLITKSTSLCFKLREIHYQEWKGISSSLILEISSELICFLSIQYLELIPPYKIPFRSSKSQLALDSFLLKSVSSFISSSF